LKIVPFCNSPEDNNNLLSPRPETSTSVSNRIANVICLTH
jgi:hypothetical protein